MNVNWRSVSAAFLSMLALLAALPYTLGDVATIIPPEFKPYVFIISVVATFIIRTVNSVGKQQALTPEQVKELLQHINEDKQPQQPKP